MDLVKKKNDMLVISKYLSADMPHSLSLKTMFVCICTTVFRYDKLIIIAVSCGYDT